MSSVPALVVDLTRFTPPGDVPKIEWRPKTELFVDSSYQRDMTSLRSIRLISNIVHNFMWRRAGIWQTTREGAIVDGQHRHAAAMLRPDVTNLPCMVWSMRPEEAALMFVGLNKDRVTVTAQAVFKAELAAGDPVAVAIMKMCEDVGIELLTYPLSLRKLRVNQTTAIQTLRHQMAIDPKKCRQTLECCLRAKASLSSTVLMMTFRELTLGGTPERVLRMLLGGKSHENSAYIPSGLLAPHVDVAPAQTTPGIKKYESGTFMDILIKTFERGGVPLEVKNNGAWRIAQFKIGNGPWVSVTEAVTHANRLRQDSGFAPLSVPR